MTLSILEFRPVSIAVAYNSKPRASKTGATLAPIRLATRTTLLRHSVLFGRIGSVCAASVQHKRGVGSGYGMDQEWT